MSFPMGSEATRILGQLTNHDGGKTLCRIEGALPPPILLLLLKLEIF